MTDGIVWFLFVIVLGLLAAIVLVCVIATVKEFYRRRRGEPTPESGPPECEEMHPVDWVPAIMVANPDDSCVWGAVEA